MMRTLACLLATLSLGCQAPPGAIDPFIGRQTVPPPGTGTPNSNPPGNSYYSENTAPGRVSNASDTDPDYSPPGGFGFDSKNNTVARQPASARAPASIPSTNRNTGSGVGTPASRDTTPKTTPNAGGAPVQSASPWDRSPMTSRSTPGAGFQVNSNPSRTGTAATTASNRSATPANRLTQPARDIMTLPGSRSATQPSKTDSGGFRPPGSVTRAGYEEEIKEPKEAAAGTTRTPRKETIGAGKYDQDKNYRWLKGKLEYSRIEDRWKLRYIPIDGDTDDFGGSVVLLGSRMLEGYKPGEYVTAYGSLGESDARGNGYAPSFNLDRVVRQSEE